MRKSRVLLAGVAVAAAAVTTSAFTASNTVQDSVAGYATADVTGAEATDITYVLDATDAALVDSIDFEVVEDITGMQAVLTLTDGGVTIDTITCDLDTFAAGTPVSCDTADTPLVDFDGIALTVAQ
jgi:hypothetical protein